MDAAAAWLTTEQMGLTALLLQSHQEVFHRPLLAVLSQQVVQHSS